LRVKSSIYAALSLLSALPAAAQERDEEPTHSEAIASIADALVEATTRRWEGPRVRPPDPSPRPEAAFTLRSSLRPLAVHAGPGVSEARAAAALEALEDFVAYLQDATRWPTFLPDVEGGDPGFDLYLTPTEALADAGSDGDVAWAFYDAVGAHALVDPDVDRMRACVASATTQALTLQLDPAEARAWRRATGSLLAWQWTGEECGAATRTQQEQPWRGWVGSSAEDGAGGGLFLRMVGERHDQGTGVFVRELWQLARQRTWEGQDLRASPDLWEALKLAIENAGDELEDMLEDFAVARWFAGGRGAQLHVLKDVHEPAHVSFELTVPELPEHTGVSPAVSPHGSIYALVDTHDAPPRSRIRVWMHGEFGVEWTLTASRVEAGREAARISVPQDLGQRRTYIPIELTPRTERVLVTATNLSHRLPDEDLPTDPHVRAMRLVFDIAQD